MQNSVVLIPTYNEADSIADLIHSLMKIEIDVIVIDDNSPDRTSKVVKDLGLDHVRVIDHGDKNGIGAAYIAGFQVALELGYKLIATMDADGSHLATDLKKMLIEGDSYDVVMGTRWMSAGSVLNWPLHRKLLSQFGTWYAKKVLAMPYRDLTGGLRVYNAQVLKKLNMKSIRSNGYCFQIEMIRALTELNAEFKEVPIQFIEREQGKSKMSKKIVIEAFVRVTFWGFQRLVGYNADKLHYVK